ncbi:MAG: hypothetical protein RL186_1471 [Pseudomonadota bacterium]
MTLVSVFALTQASAAPKKPPGSKKSAQTQMRPPAPLPIPAPEPTPVAPVAPVIATPEAIAPPQSDEAARAAFQGGLAASAAGQLPAAEAAFRQALSLAPAGENGDLVSMEAAKRLGFLAFEKRDPRMAETFFGAEAVLARRLYFSAKISARAFSDAVGRFASATGAMGRSGDSAALVFYAQEIKSRAQAETSAQLLNRDANNAADEVGSIRIADTELCVVGRDPLLKSRVSCADEAGARGEALSMQARQIRASAPPPPTKAEREAKAAKNKGKEG